MTDDPEVLRLVLYIAGQTPRSERAVMNLKRLLEANTGGAFDLQVVDVLERPDLAEEALILATPTLVKESPQPIRRLIGDLSDTVRVLRGLQLPDSQHPLDVGLRRSSG